MIKKIILIIVIVGSGLIFFTNKAKASESYSYDNLAIPNLEGKEYLGNGNIAIYNVNGLTLGYNPINGVYNLNGTIDSSANIEIHIGFISNWQQGKTYTSSLNGLSTNSYIGDNVFNSIAINTGGLFSPYWVDNVVDVLLNGGTSYLTSSNHNNNSFQFRIWSASTESMTFNNWQFTLQIEEGYQSTEYQVPISGFTEYIDIEYENGLDHGWWMGYDDGLDDGYADGYADGLDDGYNGYDIEYARVNPESDNTEWFEMQFSYKYSNWYSHLGDIAEMVNNDLSDGVGTYEKWIRWYFNSGIETNFLITFSSLTVDQVVLPESGFIQLYVKVEKDEHSYQVNFFTFGETSVYSYRDTDVVTNSYNFIYKTRLYDEGIEMYEGGYNNGYDDGYFEGKQLYGVGYNEGYNKGVSESIESGGFSMILSSMFTSVGVLLSVELLPNISIGSIVAIPIVFGVIMFIIGRKKE